MKKEDYLKEYDDTLKKISVSILNKKLIFFIGSGVSSTIKNKKKCLMPQWEIFLQELIDDIKAKEKTYSIQKGGQNEALFSDSINLLKETDKKFEEIADNIKCIYDSTIVGTSNPFLDRIQETFNADDDSVKIDKTHKWLKRLAILGANKFITTNYDTNILTAIKCRGGIDDIQEYFPFEILLEHGKQVKGVERNSIKKIRQNNTFIYKLHGGNQTPVLAKTQYNTLYKKKAFKDLLFDLFNNHTILFLGASLEKDRTVEIFKKSEYRNAYAIFHEGERRKDSYYRKELGIYPIYVSDFNEIPLVLSIIEELTRKEYERQSNLVINNPTELDADSAQKFFLEAKDAAECIFFNVQVKFQNWFTPNLQFHLNLQKAAFRLNKLLCAAECYNNNCGANGHDKCKTVIPRHSQARIYFIYQRNIEEFKGMLKDDPLFKINVKTLVNIHKLSDCSLAFVAVDKFADIILGNKSFFENTENLVFLGLTDNNSSSLKKDISDGDKQSIIDYLQKIIEQQTNQFLEEYPMADDLDFAYIKKDDGTECTWEADVFNKSLKYYASSNIKDITAYSLDENKRKDALLTFTKIMKRELFYPLSHNESERNNLKTKEYLNMNPQIFLYKKIDATNPLMNMKENMVLKDEYNAFHIIHFT
ncbi:MAG: SIR2 family protein [Bacteroidales bacterium]|jgi:hypothetical protein|nr:SIR2 family protein [Bacteroidales bacterium]